MSTNPELRRLLKTITFMKMTERVASMSYDNKHQVGALLVNKDYSNVAAIGYNGNYPGGPNERESQESGLSGFLHAEENVIIIANLPQPQDYTMYVTMTPCRMCAKRIVRKGIKEVIYLTEYGKTQDVVSIFRDGKVGCMSLWEKLLTHFAVSPLLVPVQEKCQALVRAALPLADVETELLGLLYSQLHGYFHPTPVSLANVEFAHELPADFTAYDLVLAYTYSFLRNLYRLS